MSIHDAAARLQESLGGPTGAINTLPYSGTRREYIRVLIDPSIWPSVSDRVPEWFEGFSVRVERRTRVSAN